MNYDIGDNVSSFSDKYKGVIIAYTMVPMYKEGASPHSLVKFYQPCYLVKLDDDCEIWYPEADLMVVKQACGHAKG